MTDTDFDLERAPQPEPGSYLCTIEDVALETIDGRDGAFEAMRFELVIETDKGTIHDNPIAATRDSRGDPAYGNARYKLTRWVAAFLGPLPDRLNKDSLIGAQAIAVLDLDANGFIKVVNIVPKPKGV